MKDFGRYVNSETLSALGQIWLFLGLILIPFIRYSGAAKFPEADRAVSIVIWTICMVLICVIHFLVGYSSTRISKENFIKQMAGLSFVKPIVYPFIALSIWICVSSYMNGLSEEMILGSPLRGDGLWLWLSFVLSVSCSAYLSTRNQLEMTQQTFARGWIVVAILLVFVFFVLPVLPPTTQLLGVNWLGAQLYLASMLVFGAVWIGYVAWKPHRLIVLLFISSVLVVLWRADIILPFLVALCLLPVSAFSHNSFLPSESSLRVSFWFTICCALLILLTAGGWMYLHMDDLYENISSHEGRLIIYSRFWRASEKHPLSGWGWSEMEQAYLLEVPEGDRMAAAVADKSHSLWLDWLVQTGWPGLLLYILLVGGIARELWLRGSWLNLQNEKAGKWYRFALLGFLAYLILASVNVVSVYVEWGFWILVGMIVLRNVDKRSADQTVIDRSKV